MICIYIYIYIYCIYIYNIYYIYNKNHIFIFKKCSILFLVCIYVITLHNIYKNHIDFERCHKGGVRCHVGNMPSIKNTRFWRIWSRFYVTIHHFRVLYLETSAPQLKIGKMVRGGRRAAGSPRHGRLRRLVRAAESGSYGLPKLGALSRVF